MDIPLVLGKNQYVRKIIWQKSQILKARRTDLEIYLTNWDVESSCLLVLSYLSHLQQSHATDTMAYVPFQVGMDIVIAMVLGQIDQDTCSASAIPLSAEATVADSTTWWAPPGLDNRQTTSLFN